MSLVAIVFAMYLAASAIVRGLAGIVELAIHFPDRTGADRITEMRSVSARMGEVFGGAIFWRSLWLEIYSDGLRVGVNRLANPLAVPFFVPWSDIEVLPSGIKLEPGYRFIFGDPEIGRMIINHNTGQQIAHFANGSLILPEDRD